MQHEQPVCEKCRNFFHELPAYKCKAFPNGIPDEITENGNKHKKPLKDQKNEIVFEERIIID